MLENSERALIDMVGWVLPEAGWSICLGAGRESELTVSMRRLFGERHLKPKKQQELNRDVGYSVEGDTGHGVRRWFAALQREGHSSLGREGAAFTLCGNGAICVIKGFQKAPPGHVIRYSAQLSAHEFASQKS